MGDVADMMLDGTLCAGCGEYLDMEPAGYPFYCRGCGGNDLGNLPDDGPVNKPKDPKTVACPELLCERKFRTRLAAAQHWRDKHG